MEPHFPVLNNYNVLAVSWFLSCVVCSVCASFAVGLVKHEVSNYIPIPVGKQNPIYDFPGGILNTFNHRISSQRKWWYSCRLNHWNLIWVVCCPLSYIENPSGRRQKKAWSSAPQSLWFYLWNYQLQRADGGHSPQFHHLKKVPFFTIYMKTPYREETI